MVLSFRSAPRANTLYMTRGMLYGMPLNPYLSRYNFTMPFQSPR